MKTRQIYAAYAGEKYIIDGTAQEVANATGISVQSVRKLASPSYQKQERGLQIVKLGKESVEE